MVSSGITYNGRPLEEVIGKGSSESQFGYKIGDVLSAKPYSKSSRGNPIVKTVEDKGKSYFIELVVNTNPRFQQISNKQREDLLTRLESKQPVFDEIKVKIVGYPRGGGDTYFAVCYGEDNIPNTLKNNTIKNNFSASDAHSVIYGEHVFYGLCTGRKVEKSDFEYIFDETVIRIMAYDKKGERINGFLKQVNNMSRPRWEYSWDISNLLHAEMIVSKNIIEGSKEHKFPEVKEGDNLLVRAVGDNSRMGKPNTTYFFEPVITIREYDKAIDMHSERKIITGVKGRDREVKNENYLRGDIIEDLPIITTFMTDKMGEVGVGYVARPKEEFEGLEWGVKKPFYLKKVFVKGGAENKGKLVRAEILSNKGIIIAGR